MRARPARSRRMPLRLRVLRAPPPPRRARPSAVARARRAAPSSEAFRVGAAGQSGNLSLTPLPPPPHPPLPFLFWVHAQSAMLRRATALLLPRGAAAAAEAAALGRPAAASALLHTTAPAGGAEPADMAPVDPDVPKYDPTHGGSAGNIKEEDLVKVLAGCCDGAREEGGAQAAATRHAQLAPFLGAPWRGCWRVPADLTALSPCETSAAHSPAQNAGVLCRLLGIIC